MLSRLSVLLIMTSSVICAENMAESVAPIDPSKLTCSKTHYPPMQSLASIQKMLAENPSKISQDVIEKTMTILKCTQQKGITFKPILTIIDYSLPSNQERIWVFDIAQNQLLYHTHVTHGIKSGRLYSTHFANAGNGKTSSIGVYLTEKMYRGRHGESLKLIGLDKGFNDKSYARFIVMHGAWYVAKDFIEKYGRPGRSWGCPALPVNLTQPVIDTIKDNGILIAYDNDPKWFQESQYLNCTTHSDKKSQIIAAKEPEPEITEAILFQDLNHNSKPEPNEPVLIVSEKVYQTTFNQKPPLERMLRRRINNMEYIALSDKEFNNIQSGKNNLSLDDIHFVVPDVKNVRGYFVTEMRVLPLGKLKELAISYTVHFISKPSIQLTPSTHFIRWIGL